MGCNFYLHRAQSPRCGVRSVKSGWRRALHIGKSSFGWVFVWRGYRGEDAALSGRELSTPQHWWAFLDEQLAAGAVIRSEEDEIWTPAELAEFIETKARPRPDGSLPRRHANLSHQDTVAVGSSDITFTTFS
jgi:hypothetical protein